MGVSLDCGFKKRKYFHFVTLILAKEGDMVSFLYIKVYCLTLNVSNYISNKRQCKQLF